MITKEDILKVSELSRLSLSEEEIYTLLPQFENILEFAKEIEKADPKNFQEGVHTPTPIRKDTAKASLSIEEVLRNAPLSEDSFFLLRKRSEHE